MRLLLASIAALSLAACASSSASSNDPTRPALFDVTPDGGSVSNADGDYAGDAAILAEEHCRKTKREMHVTGLNGETHSITFKCEVPG